MAMAAAENLMALTMDVGLGKILSSMSGCPLFAFLKRFHLLLYRTD
jgi:hypothetical protein